MMNTQIFDIVHTASVAKPYQSSISRSGTPAAPAVHSDSANFDSVSISGHTDEKSRFQQEMVSRLSKEVRTSTTTGRIQELRQQVSAGAYHPDPAKIARCLLFQAEG